MNTSLIFHPGVPGPIVDRTTLTIKKRIIPFTLHRRVNEKIIETRKRALSDQASMKARKSVLFCEESMEKKHVTFFEYIMVHKVKKVPGERELCAFADDSAHKEYDMRLNAIDRIIAECLYGRSEYIENVKDSKMGPFTTHPNYFPPLLQRFQKDLGPKDFERLKTLLEKSKGDKGLDFSEKLEIAAFYDQILFDDSPYHSWDT